MEKIKITNDNFIWKIVDMDEAKTLFSSGALSIYKLYENDSEALITDFEEIGDCVCGGINIGVEVGYLTKELYEKISL